MKKRIFSAVGIAGLIAGLSWGYISGNQVERDSVDAAERQLDIKLEARMIDLGDVTLHVVLAGPANGKPVILLHGYPEFWYAWRGPMAVLAKAGFRVIVPDQRGYNLSDKPGSADDYRLDTLASDITRLADALGYEKVFLVGHDFGGLVAWWTALLDPARIEKLVIVNKPHPRAKLSDEAADESISWYRTFLRIPWLPGYVARLGNWSILVENLRATSLPGTFPDPQMQQYRSAWDRDGAINSMGAWYRANAEFDSDVGEARISVTTLLVVAPDDSFSPLELALRSAAFLDNGELLELDTGTHWVIQEHPKLIGNILVDYFSRP